MPGGLGCLIGFYLFNCVTFIQRNSICSIVLHLFNGIPFVPLSYIYSTEFHLFHCVTFVPATYIYFIKIFCLIRLPWAPLGLDQIRIQADFGKLI